jgi:putative hydrolase of the HAD superfamily
LVAAETYKYHYFCPSKNKEIMIKNILFDLGHVLLDLDFERSENQFKALLQEEFEEVYKRLHEQGHFLNYELGLFDEQEFTGKIKQATQKNISETAIIDAWNSMLVEIPSQRIKMLQGLKGQFNVFLLSNTNATHIHWLDGHLQQAHQLDIHYFETVLFQKAYYSHQLKARKPDIEIYEMVLQDAGLRPEETLFIDDREDNIEGARSVGIKGYCHQVGEEISTVIPHLTPS